jgi:hypothetical protein
MSTVLRKVAVGCGAAVGVVGAVAAVAALPLRAVTVVAVCCACAPALAATRTHARSRIDRFTATLLLVSPSPTRRQTAHHGVTFVQSVCPI